VRRRSLNYFDMLFSVQYLEDRKGLENLSPVKAALKLRQAGERLPFSHVLMGWNLPSKVLQTCRQETDQMHAELFRWHPLLTGDGSFVPLLEWQVIGLHGERVAGYTDLPEFTFMCPNNPSVQQAVLAHLSAILQMKLYDGLFLDRIRFPSPAINPEANFGCFCKYCCKQAQTDGLDLTAIQMQMNELVNSSLGKAQFARALLGDVNSIDNEASRTAFEKFELFRYRSIERFLVPVVKLVKQAGLAVGLDCFSPSLAPLIAQDLKNMGTHFDWIKIMTYAHTMGPAGLPFELIGLLNYLEKTAGLSRLDALDAIHQATGLTLPKDQEDLAKNGLSSSALKTEIMKGLSQATTRIFAGIELVEIPGVAELNDNQIRSDLQAVKEAQPTGMTISWDLDRIPLDRLDLIRKVFQ
jgi:hypothetical protein